MALQIHISITHQTLNVFDENGRILSTYSVSTASRGAGEINGSFCTPLGKHIIRAKIGDNLPAETVFIARRPQTELYSEALEALYPGRDWVMARILWLSGCEVGFNRLGNVDTMRRYVYIHGCPDRTPMGTPGSHGCVRMRNADIIELYDLIPVYTQVLISK